MAEKELSKHVPIAKVVTVESISYPFPIRPGTKAVVTLPCDLKKEEAQRICGFIQSLVVPCDGPQPGV